MNTLDEDINLLTNVYVAPYISVCASILGFERVAVSSGTLFLWSMTRINPRAPTSTPQGSAIKNAITGSALPAVWGRTRQRDSTEERHVHNAPQRRRQS